MSTSYYITNKRNEKVNATISLIAHIPTQNAAHNEYYKVEKIGQSQWGWVFFLEEDFDLPLSELYELLQDKYIFDEYDREIKRDDFFKMMLKMSDRKSQGEPYFRLRAQAFAGNTYRYDVFKREGY